MEDEQKVFVSLSVVLLKKEFLEEGIVASKIELGEVQPVEEPTHSKVVIEPTVIVSHSEPILRRSSRVSHQLDSNYGF